MKATVIAATKDLTEGSNPNFLEENKTLSGKMAGICYQKNKYFDTYVSDKDKATKRFSVVANTGHHSIADHSYVTVLFEDISKMLAMVLNSCNFYNTSERSGRYTLMTGNSDKEKELYEKWKGIFHNRILELYPDYDDSALQTKLNKELKKEEITANYVVLDGTVEDDVWAAEKVESIKEHDLLLPSWKMAQENARYVLSIFTHNTTMSYTTSLRQWNYIYDWCVKAITRCAVRKEKFYADLGEELEFLAKVIKENIYVAELRDPKDRYFTFLVDLYKDRNPMVYYTEDHLGFSYNVKYDTSLVALAQEQRHRTLNYYMNFEPQTANYYIPPMIKDTALADEWLKDLESIANVYPQALLVSVIETGTLPEFILKCEERLCGRVQLETMEQVKDTAQRFMDNYTNMNSMEQLYVEQLSRNGGMPTKCTLLHSCKEPCYWGKKQALDRLI